MYVILYFAPIPKNINKIRLVSEGGKSKNILPSACSVEMVTFQKGWSSRKFAKDANFDQQSPDELKQQFHKLKNI